MKIKKTLLAGLLMMGFASASAQDKVVAMEDVFNPHWYVQVQPLGMQYTLGEGSTGDLLSYNLQVAGGYNFNKLLGARFAINAFQSKAGWDWENAQANWKWNYVAPSLDVTLNLSNVLFGYSADRLFTLSAFAGVGVNIAFSNDEASEVSNFLKTQHYSHTSDQNMRYLWTGTKARVLGQFGLMGDFRINDNWSVGVELQANTLNDKYNSKKAGNSDWYFNGLVGVKYAFGKTSKKQPVVLPYMPTAAPATDATEKVVEKIVEKVVEKKVYVETTIAEIRRDINFNRAGNTKISANEMVKVKDIAEFMNQYPTAKVTLVGYADKATGNAKINAVLAEKRVKAVAEALMKKFNIDDSRISIDHKGDTVQPFTGAAANRVTICVAKAKVEKKSE